MDLSNYSIAELIKMYSSIINELKDRGVLKTRNFVGELGEYLVFEFYNQSSKLPKLTSVPQGTKNINAIDSNGMRYSIKSTTNNVSGVIYGLQPYGSNEKNVQLFEYVILCKLSETYELQGIYQLSWDNFLKHKKWHSRMAAWNIPLSQKVISDSFVIYEKGNNRDEIINDNTNMNGFASSLIDSEEVSNQTDDKAITWKKICGVNHEQVRSESITIIQKILKCNLNKESQSRYVTTNRNIAVFVLSASYSQKNREYWYSINDDNIPWFEPFPKCYIAFALGSPSQILMFSYEELKTLMKACLKTQEDIEKHKKAHYHFSFAIEKDKVFFKKKLPVKKLVDVTQNMIKEVK